LLSETDSSDEADDEISGGRQSKSKSKSMHGSKHDKEGRSKR
jgi:hypothetical protein